MLVLFKDVKEVVTYDSKDYGMLSCLVGIGGGESI